MKLPSPLVCLGIGCALIFEGSSLGQDTSKKEKAAAFTFADTNYFYRWRNEDSREYTPAGQDDLKAWKDMVTVVYYRNAKDDKSLEKVANTTKGLYQASNGLIVRAVGNPKTAEKPAEYLIVVMFVTAEFREVAFARFRMHDGVGAAVVYSHRIYGKEVGEEMGAWIGKNGPKTENALMKWDGIPKIEPAK